MLIKGYGFNDIKDFNLTERKSILNRQTSFKLFDLSFIESKP